MVELTDAQVDAAIERGKVARLNEPRAQKAYYDRQLRRVIIELTNGCGFRRRRPPNPIASRPPIQSDGGHHSNRMVARLASSRRSILLMS